MGVEVACCSAELGSDGACLKHFQLTAQSVYEDLYFLAEACGACGLTVGLCQHRHLRPFLGILVQLADEFLNLRIVHLVQCVLDAQGHTCVVDILACESEMDELFVCVESANGIELFLDEIFNCLDVVVGYLLNVLDTLCVICGEILVDLAQAFEQLCGERCQLGQGQLAQGDEIFDLNTYTVADECILGKIFYQRLCLASVTTINR